MNSRHLLVLFALLLPAVAVAQDAAIRTALNHITTNYASIGVSEADVSDLAVTDAYTSRRSGTMHVYVNQRHRGIGVVDARLTVNVSESYSVFHVAGSFEADVAARAATSTPVISAVNAAEILADDIGRSTGIFTIIESEGGTNQAVVLSNDQIARLPIPVKLVYRPEEDELKLAWEVILYERDAEHYWYANVDALSGEILFKHDQVVYDMWLPEGMEAPAVETDIELDPSFFVAPMAPLALVGSYRAFALPDESPNHSTPAAPLDGRILHANPDDAAGSPFGWHDTNGAPGAESTLTTGNNVDSHKGATRPDCTGTLNCDFPANFANSPVTFVPAAIANNFYLSNILHDITYRYGFDEASGNFQENNYGNGGLGSDGVNANVQAPGNCNATMGTPPDGSNPTMNMFICTAANPDSDSDFDTGVLFHEYGHGISHRLTGGPGTTSCLNNSEQMGEGWSDYLGILLTIEPGDTGPDKRGVGTYFIGQPTTGNGARPQPYSTNPAINNAVHTDICGQGVHNVGWVWASIVWEVSWQMIDVYGFNPDIYDETSSAGNNVMLQLVIEGMKLQPCSPGFVDARDAILQADINLYGGIHLFELWEGFAIRGLGETASQGSSNSTCDNTNDFNNPIPVELVAFSATVDGSDLMLNWSTASETNNAGFEVQMLTEDNGYDVLGFVEGHGTTTEAQTYSFRAADLPVGTHTFRLKQIDFDGAFEYSGEVEATVGVVGTYRLSDVYPNPFNPQAQFTLAVASAQNVNIAIYDVMGRRVATLHEGQLDANETYNFTVDGANLASGAYFVRIAGEAFTEARRITLLK